MLEINLVSSVTNTFTEALEIAKQLAITISASPHDGIVNTMRLLRPVALSDQELAKICVSYVKALVQSEKSLTESSPMIAAIQWIFEDKITWLTKNPNKIIEIGNNAKKHIINTYDNDLISKELVQFYKNL